MSAITLHDHDDHAQSKATPSTEVAWWASNLPRSAGHDYMANIIWRTLMGFSLLLILSLSSLILATNLRITQDRLQGTR